MVSLRETKVPLVVLPGTHSPQHVGQDVMGSTPGCRWHGTARHSWAGMGPGHGSEHPGLGKAVPVPRLVWPGQASNEWQRFNRTGWFPPLEDWDQSWSGERWVVLFCWKGLESIPVSLLLPWPQSWDDLAGRARVSGMWVRGSPGRPHPKASAA